GPVGSDTAVDARRAPGGCLPRHAGRCSAGVALGPGTGRHKAVNARRSRLRPTRPRLARYMPVDRAAARREALGKEMRMETALALDATPRETRSRAKEPYAALLGRLSHQSVVKHFD